MDSRQTAYFQCFNALLLLLLAHEKRPKTPSQSPDLSGLSAAEVLDLVAGLQQQVADKDAALEAQKTQLNAQASFLQQRERYILLLEELLRLKKIQQFAARSEKSAYQAHLFDETELEAEIDTLRDQLPDDVDEPDAPRVSRQRRQRGFSDKLIRERIELTLSEEQKAGATKTFFTKVKEELQFIPAQLKVLEYWQEKAVFPGEGNDHLLAAERPIHPLGKCTASTSLLAYVITSKYADGLPL